MPLCLIDAGEAAFARKISDFSSAATARRTSSSSSDVQVVFVFSTVWKFHTVESGAGTRGWRTVPGCRFDIDRPMDQRNVVAPRATAMAYISKEMRNARY